MLEVSLAQAIVVLQVAALLATIVVPIILGLQCVTTRRNHRNRSEDATPRLAIPFDNDFPTIHATSGVPTFEQLTKDIEIEPKDGLRARVHYELGLEQFKHYVNNRDGVIEEARYAMASLSEQMDHSEITVAERIGIALAGSDVDDDSEVEIQFDSLQPQTQIYALHKKREQVALQSIVRDLRRNVSRTDYTSVKSIIESGEMALAAIMSELPLPWQDLRTINHAYRSDPRVTKPPRREFIDTMFLMPEGKILVDRRAERDGKWLVSGKHELAVPYEALVPVIRIRHPGDSGVPTGRYVAMVNKDLGTEWVTEIWRRGGYRDQKYVLARDGMLPKQIRAAYRRRQIRRTLWGALLLLAIVDIVLLGQRFL